MLQPPLVDRIRGIFLHSRPHVSIPDATVLLGWTPEEMTSAIQAGEIELMTTPLGSWVWREELMAKALELWPQDVIEAALGGEARRVLPEPVRLAPLHARVRQYQLWMLEYLAEREHTTLDEILARELDALANAHAEELAMSVRGFLTALNWPAGAEGSIC